jgi:hypothetical protein
MKTLSILLLSVVSCFTLAAQDVKSTLYKGTINSRPVTLYLKQEPNPCGGETGLLYQGIYRYGAGKEWIELGVSTNGKGNFVMTEFKFTGVMILNKKAATLEGIWISSDGKTQLNVILKQQVLSDKQKEEMEEDLEKTHHENYDC